MKDVTLKLDRSLLHFRCTQCGRCCREPLLPLTVSDAQRIFEHIGASPEKFVRWVGAREIDLADQPEAFVELRPGRRVMVMRQGRSGCYFLGQDARCTIYQHRPLGCQVFPFDAEHNEAGKLVRLERILAAQCQSESGGRVRLAGIRVNQRRFEREVEHYHALVADWNRQQRARRRAGQLAESGRAFLRYLGLLP